MKIQWLKNSAACWRRFHFTEYSASLEWLLRVKIIQNTTGHEVTESPSASMFSLSDNGSLTIMVLFVYLCTVIYIYYCYTSVMIGIECDFSILLYNLSANENFQLPTMAETITYSTSSARRHRILQNQLEHAHCTRHLCCLPPPPSSSESLSSYTPSSLKAYFVFPNCFLSPADNVLISLCLSGLHKSHLQCISKCHASRSASKELTCLLCVDIVSAWGGR